jgi:hypothetical protein
MCGHTWPVFATRRDAGARGIGNMPPLVVWLAVCLRLKIRRRYMKDDAPITQQAITKMFQKFAPGSQAAE